MKLNFERLENGDIKVWAIYKQKKEEFNYIKMIKSLYDNNEIEDPLIGADIADNDKETIKSMVEEIRKAAAKRQLRKTR